MKKGIIIVACSFTLLLLTFILFIKFIYFYKKLPTKKVKIEDIKSVQVLSLDYAVERRNNYENMLKTNFGDKFLGLNINHEIRLKDCVNGKEQAVFENIDNGEKISYNSNAISKIVFLDGIYKVYPKNHPETYYYFTNLNKTIFVDNTWWWNYFGAGLSHLKAIQQIREQKDDTYGLILEDDFLVDKDFYKKMENVLNEAPADFDVIKLSLQHRRCMDGYKKIAIRPNTLQVILKSFKQFGYGNWVNNSVMKNDVKQFTHGAQAYIVSKKGAEKIANYYRNNLCTSIVDIELFLNIPKKDKTIKVYTYLKEMPILLRNDAKKSLVDVE